MIKSIKPLQKRHDKVAQLRNLNKFINLVGRCHVRRNKTVLIASRQRRSARINAHFSVGSKTGGAARMIRHAVK